MAGKYSERRHNEIRFRDAKEAEKNANKRKRTQEEIDANIVRLDEGQGFFKSLFGKKTKK